MVDNDDDDDMRKYSKLNNMANTVPYPKNNSPLQASEEKQE